MKMKIKPNLPTVLEGLYYNRSFPLQALAFRGRSGSLLGAFSACGVSLGHVFPAGVSRLPFQSTLHENEDQTQFAHRFGGFVLRPLHSTAGTRFDLVLYNSANQDLKPLDHSKKTVGINNLT